MNNVGEKYLPLGTVVMLKGASKRLMVTGFCTMAAEDESGVMYDYSGCMYPEGVISSDQTALFDHDQIEKIYHMGLVDQEENDFKLKLKQLVNSQNVVSESAPTAIREAEGIAPVAPVAPVQPVEAPVPPVGPGLPGYVAPQPATPVAPVAPVAAATAVAPVPPVGPGLPGYVAPQPAAPVAPVAPAVNGIQFDANGTVIAAPVAQPAEAPAEGSGEAPAAPNYVFDENGVLISA